MFRRSPATRMAGNKCVNVLEPSTASRTGFVGNLSGGPDSSRRSDSSNTFVSTKLIRAPASSTAFYQTDRGPVARPRRRARQSDISGNQCSSVTAIAPSPVHHLGSALFRANIRPTRRQHPGHLDRPRPLTPLESPPIWRASFMRMASYLPLGTVFQRIRSTRQIYRNRHTIATARERAT